MHRCLRASACLSCNTLRRHQTRPALPGQDGGTSIAHQHTGEKAFSTGRSEQARTLPQCSCRHRSPVCNESDNCSTNGLPGSPVPGILVIHRFPLRRTPGPTQAHTPTPKTPFGTPLSIAPSSRKRRRAPPRKLTAGRPARGSCGDHRWLTFTTCARRHPWYRAWCRATRARP